MGEKYLIDTNVLIDAQVGNLPERGLQFLANVIDEEFTVSFVTYIEFLGYRDATQATQEFIALASVIEIDKRIMNICVGLRKTQRIKLPDAIIAATAIGNGLTIITNNEKDLNKITGLSCVNPHKI